MDCGTTIRSAQPSPEKLIRTGVLNGMTDNDYG